MAEAAMRLPARFYRSAPLDQRGHVEIALEIPTSSAALVLCDVYGTGFDEGAARPEQPPLMSSWDIWELQRTMMQDVLAPLTRAWRSAGLAVVYVENRYPDLAWEGGRFASWWRDSTGFNVSEVIGRPGRQWEYSQLIEPQPDDYLITKAQDDAFCDTSLDLLLRNLRVRHLVMAGFAAECCLLSTIQGAYQRGYETVLVRDACLADEHHDTEAGLQLTNWAIRVVESSRGPSAVAADVVSALATRAEQWRQQPML